MTLITVGRWRTTHRGGALLSKFQTPCTRRRVIAPSPLDTMRSARATYPDCMGRISDGRGSRSSRGRQCRCGVMGEGTRQPHLAMLWSKYYYAPPHKYVTPPMELSCSGSNSSAPAVLLASAMLVSGFSTNRQLRAQATKVVSTQGTFK